MGLFKDLWICRDYILRFLVPIIFLPILYISDRSETRCAYGVCVMLTYWLFEIFPLSITALLPLVIFPLLGVMTSAAAAKAFINSTLMVFLGSIIASAAVEKCNLHMRIALKIILLFGTSIERFLLGFMITTAVLSMFISNIATAAIIMPMINAAFEQLVKPLLYNEENILESIGSSENISLCNKDGKQSNTYHNRRKYSFLSRAEVARLRKGILLGNCYASVIAGTATLTGNPTNLMLNAFLQEQPVSYSDWFFFNFPGVMIMIFLTWIFFCVFYVKHQKGNTPTKEQETQIYELITHEYEKLGPIAFKEIAVLIIFMFLTASLFLRNPDFMPGWSVLFSENSNDIDDQVPAIFSVILFFAIPSEPTRIKTSPALLEWKDVQERTCWGIILLLGGSFSMARSFQDSGLSKLIADQLIILSSELSIFTTLFILCIISMTLTEFMSNVSTGTIILPVVKEVALSLDLNPLSMMLPMTLCSNYGFMLPIASAMTAIFYESGHMRLVDMIVPGFAVKIICFVIHLFMLYTWGPFILNLSNNNEISNSTEIHPLLLNQQIQ